MSKGQALPAALPFLSIAFFPSASGDEYCVMSPTSLAKQNHRGSSGGNFSNVTWQYVNG